MRHEDQPARLAPAQASARLRRRAHALIPGGCHTYAKGDDQYPVLAPGFIARGAGCRVWDTDGREYIEYGMGNRTVGLGHAYPPVVQAVRQELARGSNFTRPSPIEVACAEQFLALIDGAEMVKFCKDGSDATSGAVRLARAYTGRDLIACCADHPFFSVDDWFIGTTPVDAGIPLQIQQLTLTFRTRQAFGNAVWPHLFRDCAVTELVDCAPRRSASHPISWATQACRPPESTTSRHRA